MSRLNQKGAVNKGKVEIRGLIGEEVYTLNDAADHDIKFNKMTNKAKVSKEKGNVKRKLGK